MITGIQYGNKRKNTFIVLFDILVVLLEVILTIQFCKSMISRIYFTLTIAYNVVLILVSLIVLLKQTYKDYEPYILSGMFSCYYFVLVLTNSAITMWVIIIPLIILLVSYGEKKLVFAFGVVAFIVNILKLAISSVNITFTNVDYLIQLLIISLSVIYALKAVSIINNNIDKINELTNDVVVDSLTCIYNRHFLDDYIKKVKWSTKLNFSLSIIDVDKFKSINDTYGHKVGDTVLKTVATTIKESLNGLKDTYIIRFGGDEFMIVSKTLDMLRILEVSKKCIDLIEKKDIIVQDDNNIEQVVKISISTGESSTIYDGLDSFEKLYIQADERLYKVKKSKGNA